MEHAHQEAGEGRGLFGSIATSVLTGIFAAIPGEALGLLQRLGTVFALAAAAELGRRVVGLVWKRKA